MHDLGPDNRWWGHDYAIQGVLDDGSSLKLAVWLSPMAESGDFLLLDNKGRPTRYAVREVRPCADPPDMAFLVVEFAPRQAAAAPASDGGDGGGDVQQ